MSNDPQWPRPGSTYRENCATKRCINNRPDVSVGIKSYFEQSGQLHQNTAEANRCQRAPGTRRPGPSTVPVKLAEELIRARVASEHLDGSPVQPASTVLCVVWRRNRGQYRLLTAPLLSRPIAAYSAVVLLSFLPLPHLSPPSLLLESTSHQAATITSSITFSYEQILVECSFEVGVYHLRIRISVPLSLCELAVFCTVIYSYYRVAISVLEHFSNG